MAKERQQHAACSPRLPCHDVCVQMLGCTVAYMFASAWMQAGCQLSPHLKKPWAVKAAELVPLLRFRCSSFMNFCTHPPLQQPSSPPVPGAIQDERSGHLHCPARPS